MPRIELYTGLPGSGRHAQVKELVESHSDGVVYWLVDEMRRVEQCEQEICDHLGGALVGVEVLAAGRLAGHILNESGKRIPTIDVESRRLLLRDLMSSAKITAQLGSEASPGWTNRIEEFYLRREEERFFGPRTGRKPVQAIFQTSYPWMLDVIETYERRLEEAGLIDETSLPSIVCEWMTNAAFHPPSLLIVDRPGPLRPPVLEVLHRLAEHAERTVVLIDEMEDAGAGLDLAHQDGTTWRKRHHCDIVSFRPPAKSAQIAKALFAPPGGAPADTIPVSVFLSHHIDRAAEVRYVAGQVSRLLNDEHVPEREIAVVCTSLQQYAPHVQELFGRYGIRPDLRLGQPLSTSPVARLMAAFFTLRSEGISREGITDVLLNPYVTWGRFFADKANVLSFDTVARRARIVDGRDGLQVSWIDPFTAELARMREQANLLQEEEADREVDSGAGGGARKERLLRQVKTLERALEEFRSLVLAILRLPDPCTVDEALDWLRSMQHSLNIRTSVHRMARRDPEKGQRDVLALGHLELTLDHVATTLRLQGKKRWPVSKFAELMRLAISSGRLRSGRRLHGGVPVLGPLELRGLRVKHLFFLGLTADAWPRSPGIDIADPFASTWSDIDLLAESRALTLEAFFAAEKIHLSTPCPKRGEGRDAPSPLLDELEPAGIYLDQQVDEDADTYRSALDLLPALGHWFESNDQSLGLRRLAVASGQTADGEIAWERVPLVAAVESQRLDPTNLTRYEGMLNYGGIGGRIVEQVQARPWSASRLDTYATCPMKFLLGNVLKIEGVEEVEDEMDAASLGSLVHEVLARSTQKLRVLREGPVDLSTDPEQVAQVMDETAVEVLAHYPFDNLYWRKTVDAVRSGLLNPDEPAGYLRRLLDHHAEKMAGETIHFVEAGFGLPVDQGEELLIEEPIRITVEGVTIPLAGRIDRISRHPKKGWCVWDYKVAKQTPSNVRKIAGGRSFQLPLYFWALEELRDSGRLEDVPFERSSYYVMKPEGKPTQSQVWKFKDQERESDQLKARVVAIDKALQAGRFHHPLSQDSDLCPEGEFNFCPFRQVCRKDHDLFGEREAHLSPQSLREAYILGFQESLSERVDKEGGEA